MPKTGSIATDHMGCTCTVAANGRATAAGSSRISHAVRSVTGSCIAETTPINFTLLRENTPVSGGPSALVFTGTAPIGVETYTVRFSGSLSGSIITGRIKIDGIEKFRGECDQGTWGQRGNRF